MSFSKQSFFQRILLPLVVLILVLALTFYLAVYLSGTTKLLDKNAVHILEQTATNRHLILENNMAQQWSNLQEDAEAINGQLKALLTENGVDTEEFMASPELQGELLQEVKDDVLLALRKRLVTGVFLVLADDAMERQQEHRLPGFYFRDANPLNNPDNYSDMLMQRGSADISHSYGIPFDSQWEPDFIISAVVESPKCRYFYRPFNAARFMPELGSENLGYWSPPFYLNAEKDDSYQMITYSIPLIAADKTVYGVMGIDISVQYLMDLLPSRELEFEGKQRGGYLLALRDGNDNVEFMVGSGAAARQLESITKKETLETTEYSELYRLSHAQLYGSDIYSTLHNLRLYNTNTPFAQEQWVLLSIATENQLFGLGERLLYILSFALLISLSIGIVAIYLTASLVTSPLRKLSKCIEGSDENNLENFQTTNIREIDDLYDVINGLTVQQKQTKLQLLEEKGRYQAALESSTSALFEYDAKTDVMRLYNVSRGTQSFPMEEFADCRRRLAQEKLIHEDDKSKVDNFFDMVADYKNDQFRGCFLGDDEGYRWLQVRAKTIYDSEGRVSKMIGSLQDIHEEKEKQLQEADLSRRDSLTGLYSRDEGIRLVECALSRKKKGCLILFNVDHFQELNDSLGMVMGDVILEEGGQLLIGLLGTEEVALRFGGDKFAVWLPFRTEDEVEEFCRQYIRIFERTSPEVTCSAGYVRVHSEREDTQFMSLIRMALLALQYGKAQGSSAVQNYERLPEEHQNVTLTKEELDCKIIGIHYHSSLSIVSLTFNMFDKTSDLHRIMPILLRKVGNYFHLTDLVMTNAEQDFYTNYISYQWSRTGEVASGRVHHYTESAYLSCVESIQTSYLRFSDSGKELTAQQCSFFHIREGRNGFCFPMVINGCYMGSIAFLDRNLSRIWSNQEENNFNEIVKIIITNTGKARSDLASKAKSEFLSRMSHEIRTPMNAIVGMVDIAKSDPMLSDKAADCLKKISSSSQYLLSIINDILDMSRIESGKLTLAPAQMSLNRTLENLDDLIRPQAEELGLDFQIKTGLVNSNVVGDAMRINQVLLNLLSNALKFTGQGHVFLEVRQEPIDGQRYKVTFTVEDTGIGVSKENAERIFHTFVQAEDDTASQYGGTGLGLAISRSLVQMMGGTLRLESQVNKGSRFHFTIFMNAAEQAPLEQIQNEQKVYDFTGKRLLLVEDNEINTEIAQTILTMNGFLVEHAENGQVAVDMFRDSPQEYYQIVLMDIRMPVMDGLQATRAIRNLCRPDARTVSIIAMSANAFDEDMKKSIESGMNGHLAKPIDVPKLKEMLAQCLEL